MSMHRRDSSVGIATDYRMNGWRSIPSKGNTFLHSVQTESGTHPVSYPMGTGSVFPGVKEKGEVDHKTSPSAEVKNSGVIPSLPSTSSWRDA
jgi:hypothetical protein